jgi:hypothetical protein
MERTNTVVCIANIWEAPADIDTSKWDRPGIGDREKVISRFDAGILITSFGFINDKPMIRLERYPDYLYAEDHFIYVDDAESETIDEAVKNVGKAANSFYKVLKSLIHSK